VILSNSRTDRYDACTRSKVGDSDLDRRRRTRADCNLLTMYTIRNRISHASLEQ
jgi:hypothetical protein